jgi:DNA polymerase
VAVAIAAHDANSTAADGAAETSKPAELQYAATSGRGYTGRGLDFVDLGALARDVHECRRCPLGFSRTHAVPGVGPSSARIMVVGEAPGQNEDQQGEPFVGAAGKLLDQLLRGIGLSRSDVFITNILKCRPPNNRDPQPAEVQACSPYLEQQLLLIKPEVVLILGRHALARLLPGQESISRLHGHVIVKDAVTYIPVYHPAAALYNSFLMGPLEQDFKAVKAHLDRVEERRRAALVPATPAPKPEEQLTLFG